MKRNSFYQLVNRMHIDIFLEIHFEALTFNVIHDKDLNPVAKSVLNEGRSDEDLNPLYIEKIHAKYVISAFRCSMKDRKCEEYEYKCVYKNMLSSHIKKYANKRVSEIKKDISSLKKGIFWDFF